MTRRINRLEASDSLLTTASKQHQHQHQQGKVGGDGRMGGGDTGNRIHYRRGNWGRSPRTATAAFKVEPASGPQTPAQQHAKATGQTPWDAGHPRRANPQDFCLRRRQVSALRNTLAFPLGPLGRCTNHIAPSQVSVLVLAHVAECCCRMRHNPQRGETRRLRAQGWRQGIASGGSVIGAWRAGQSARPWVSIFHAKTASQVRR